MIGTMFIIGNLLVAVSFAVEGACLLWLFRGWAENWQRRRATLMIGAAMLTCSASRFSYAAIGWHRTPALIVTIDWITGLTGIAVALPMPWIVAAIRRLPTADQVAAEAKIREAEGLAEARVDFERQLRDRAQAEADRRGRQLVQLGLVLQGASVPEDLKDRISRLINGVE